MANIHQAPIQEQMVSILTAKMPIYPTASDEWQHVTQAKSPRRQSEFNRRFVAWIQLK